MATEVKVPALGESVSEASIGQWLKQPGDAVALDEPIASLETDKVAIDVSAPTAGVMGAHLAKEGDTVTVGAVIALIEAGVGTGLRDAATAAALAGHSGTLGLDGLTELDDEAAARLAAHRGPLSLAGLQKASATARAALERHDGPLFLDSAVGVTTPR